MKSATATNCNALTKNDIVECRAAGGKVTVGIAHSEHHSFGGDMPMELTQGLTLLNGQDPVYPPELYVHYDNRSICDICGHRCLPG